MRVCSFHRDFKGPRYRGYSRSAAFPTPSVATSAFLWVVLLLTSRLPTFWALLLQQSYSPPTSVTHARCHIPNITADATTSQDLRCKRSTLGSPSPVFLDSVCVWPAGMVRSIDSAVFHTLSFLSILFTHLSFHGGHHSHTLACTQLLYPPTILLTRWDSYPG